MLRSPFRTLRLGDVSHALWWPRVLSCGVLLVTDILALLGVWCLAYVLWVSPVLHQSPEDYVSLAPLFSLFLLGYAGAGLYPGFGMGAVETLRRLSWCTSGVFVVMAAVSFMLKWPHSHSRVAFVMAWITSLIVLPLLRFLVLVVVSRWSWWGEPTVLLGSEPWMQWTIAALKNALSLGYRPLAALAPDPHWHGGAVQGVPVLGGPEMAPYLAARGMRVVLLEEKREENFAETLNWLQQHFQHVVLIRERQDLPVERAQIRNLGGVLGIEVVNGLLGWKNRWIKRTLDLVLGSLFLILAAPLIVLAGLVIRVYSHGPSFFYHEREGLGGSRFMVWKLRTMYQDAERRLDEFLAANPELRREWEQHVKLTHDPRVIAGVGDFLRRFSLDELPQLWNVIRGQMSLVGPRPFPEYHLQQFPSEFRELRQRVRPGLTGMWQVMIRSDGGLEEQQMYDTYYIRNWSIWLDFYILARTVLAVLASKGAR